MSDTPNAMHGVVFDHARAARIGMPEAVFSERKSRDALVNIFRNHAWDKPVLFTRLAADVFASMPADIQEHFNYHPLSGTAYAHCLPKRENGSVAIVSAGTADAPVTWEAARTLEYLGIAHTVYEDSGVAGLWRLTTQLDAVNSHDVIIVVAGLDAALSSVMGGLTPKPVFAVPTSVGYGMARQGESALSSMLVSCAPGIGVMNIDNGYGAACAASRIISLLDSKAAR